MLILLLELILIVLPWSKILLVLILNRTLLLNIPLLIIPREVWMVLPSWIISIIVGIFLLHKIHFFNLLHNCNTMHGIMRSTIKFTTHNLNKLNLSYLLSTSIHCLKSSFNFCSNLVFHLYTMSN